MSDTRWTLTLAFIRSLSFCDHMGDVANKVNEFFGKAGQQTGTWDDLDELSEILGGMGVPYLHQTGDNR